MKYILAFGVHTPLLLRLGNVEPVFRQGRIICPIENKIFQVCFKAYQWKTLFIMVRLFPKAVNGIDIMWYGECLYV